LLYQGVAGCDSATPHLLPGKTRTIMKKHLRPEVILVIALITVPVLIFGQVQKKDHLEKKEPLSAEEILEMKRVLLADLSSLAGVADKTHSPITKAAGKTEIADVVWMLDREWAQKLLLEAFNLSLPDREEKKMQNDIQSKGFSVAGPSSGAIARGLIRQRVLGIARRDPVFADKLIEAGKKDLGDWGKNATYSALAAEALKAGEIEQAGNHLTSLFDADPVDIGAGGGIREMAIYDRGEADRLTMEYITRLRQFSLTRHNAPRVFSNLRRAVFPVPPFDSQGRKIPVAGPEVIRAWLEFTIESLTFLELKDTGATQELRLYILSLWPYVRNLAPDLTEAYFRLESVTRIPGRPDSLPAQSQDDRSKTDYQEKVGKISRESTSDQIIETFKLALGRQDYQQARLLLGFLKDKQKLSAYSEMLNEHESAYLLSKGEFLEALPLARELRSDNSILRVYPRLIESLIKQKEETEAQRLVSDALRILADNPDSKRRSLSLSTLAGLVLPLNQTMAIEILNQAVLSANRSDRTSPEIYKPDFETKVFSTLAEKREPEAVQIAFDLKDDLQRIFALNAIYQTRAKKINTLISRTASKGF
jgi:hypothetical protein